MVPDIPYYDSLVSGKLNSTYKFQSSKIKHKNLKVSKRSAYANTPSVFKESTFGTTNFKMAENLNLKYNVKI
jgi:uncharacterized protein YcgL (UPF0745 family)